MFKRIAASAIALLVTVGLLTSPAGADDQTYEITRTNIGLMFRTDPGNWASKAGQAGYDGDRVVLTCQTTGVGVGDYNNHTWYKGRTKYGEGYLPDAYLTTPINADEELPGLRKCGDDSNTADEGAGASKETTSVFFSGTDTPQGSAPESVSDKDYGLNEWASGGTCTSGHILAKVPDSVTTLAGWSRGRTGVIYFLASASEERANKINRIVLFDPGSLRDIEGTAIGPFHKDVACDYKYNPRELLANWLAADDSHELYIVTGLRTEMKEDPDDLDSNSTFKGLWRYYIGDMRDASYADRAVICDYNGASHEDALSNYYDVVNGGDCPDPIGTKLQRWTP